MLRTACAFMACALLLTFLGGSPGAQVGKKPPEDKKKPEVKKVVEGKKADPKKEADARTKGGPTYIPLDVTNRWEYSVTTSDKAATNDKPTTMVTRIMRVETKGLPVAIFESTVDGKLVQIEALRHTDLGVFRFRSGNITPTPAMKILGPSPVAGEKWKGTFTVGNYKAAYSVELEDDDVEVPAGSFKTIRAALKISTATNTTLTTSWYAKDIGLVKQSVEGGATAVLEKFEVKNPPAEFKEARRARAYYPLEIGNSWEYDRVVNGKADIILMRVTKTEVIDGVKLTSLEAESGGLALGGELLRQTEKGVLLYRMHSEGKGTATLTPPVLIVKAPLKGGDKWSGEFEANGVNMKYSVETEEEEIQVAAGKFRTIRVKRTTSEPAIVVRTVWYAENIGPIKHMLEQPGTNVVISLRKHLKPVQAAPGK
jgi:hypothetical protein